jgi:hypothetical protein
MVDAGSPPEAKLVRARAAAAIHRAHLLVSASRQLIQKAERQQRSALNLLDSLSEVRHFIRENRGELDRTLHRGRLR